MSEPLCGDVTCTNYACTQEALDAWIQHQEDEARALVREALGLPS